MCSSWRWVGGCRGVHPGMDAWVGAGLPACLPTALHMHPSTHQLINSALYTALLHTLSCLPAARPPTHSPACPNTRPSTRRPCTQVRMNEGSMPPLVLVVAPPLTARNMLSDSPDVAALAKRVEPTRDRVGHWPGKPRCCRAAAGQTGQEAAATGQEAAATGQEAAATGQEQLQLLAQLWAALPSLAGPAARQCWACLLARTPCTRPTLLLLPLPLLQTGCGCMRSTAAFSTISW